MSWTAVLPLTFGREAINAGSYASSNLTGAGGWGGNLSSPNYFDVGQTFWSATTARVLYSGFWLNKTKDFDGFIYSALWGTEDGSPLTRLFIASSASVASEDIVTSASNTTASWVTFEFSQRPLLGSNTTYLVSVGYADDTTRDLISTTTCLRYGVRVSDGTHAGGNYILLSNTTWDYYGDGVDMVFDLVTRSFATNVNEGKFVPLGDISDAQGGVDFAQIVQTPETWYIESDLPLGISSNASIP